MTINDDENNDDHVFLNNSIFINQRSIFFLIPLTGNCYFYYTQKFRSQFGQFSERF